jgi:hypothetical protein
MLRGMEGWVTRDYGSDGKGLALSKSRLGEFTYHLLKLGGRITSTYTMNPNYERSYVQFAIVLPEGKAEELTQLTGVLLEQPPRITLA